MVRPPEFQVDSGMLSRLIAGYQEEQESAVYDKRKGQEKINRKLTVR